MTSKSSKTAVYAASEGCRSFQQRIRTATKRAVSFIESFYHIGSNVVVPPINGSCTDYSSMLKKMLNVDLVSCLAGNSIHGLSELEWLSFSASLASIPKSWPESCDCMVEGLEEELKTRLTKERLVLPDGYLDHVKECVLEIFPTGIRSGEFQRQAARVTPPFSSCTEFGRKDGGSYSSWMGCREDYLSKLEKPKLKHQPVFMVANAPGKPRPLVKNHSSYLLLRPLHTAIYDRISRQRWLLRGNPSRNKFVRAGMSTGSSYFSADFSAATDSLPIEVAECILDTLAMKSSPSVIPLLSEARRSLRPLINFSDGPVCPTTGQLMGNLLSFPLLCLQNYCSVMWVNKCTGLDVPFLINGDDLVAEAPASWVSCYRGWSPRLGFSLNEKKTSFSRRSLNVNSTYFTSNFKLIPFVRCAGLSLRDPRDIGNVMNDIVKPFSSCRSNKTRSLVHHLSIHFRDLVRKSGLTLHSLGFRVSKESELRLTYSIKKREKERSGHPLRKIPRQKNLMGLNLVQAEDPFEVHEDSDVRDAVVREHWDGGEFQVTKKERLKEVIKKLRKERMTRWRKLGTRETLKRLIGFPVCSPKVWIPSKLADCYDLTHDTVRISEDGFVEYDGCDVCDRVRAVIRRRKLVEYESFSISEGAAMEQLYGKKGEP
nr:MAG: RNA-dependent RNA polymerase [Botourmiaviridae sp.]